MPVTSTRDERRTARERLLDAVLVETAAHGLRDRSLRELAAAVGTSHRMLLYHFGDREGLVAAVVERVEADQRRVLLDAAERAEDPSELVRILWDRVSSPELLPFVRLFFENLGTPGIETPDRTQPWLDDAPEVTARVGIAFDPVEIRLGVAVVRGLLVDVLATGDRAAATEALERHLSRWPG